MIHKNAAVYRNLLFNLVGGEQKVEKFKGTIFSSGGVKRRIGPFIGADLIRALDAVYYPQQSDFDTFWEHLR